MPVCSYLVHPAEGLSEFVINDLQSIPGCEVSPSEDGKVLILVTESDNSSLEKALQKRLKDVENIDCMALTFGQLHDVETEERGK